MSAIASALGGNDEIARAATPETIDRARAERPGLVVQAATTGRVSAIELLVELGWDVNAKARQDLPIEQEWETALHAAVSNGDGELVLQLLAAGADPTIKDSRFDATPLGWARHGGHTDLIEILGRVTPDDT